VAVAVLHASSPPQTIKPAPQGLAAPSAPAEIAPATASIAGRVTSADGKPLARARVLVAADEVFECPPNTPPGKTENCTRYNRIAITGTDGRYTIDKLPAGKTYVITANKSGFATRAFGETAPAAPPPPLVLKQAETRTGIDIQLPPQHFVTGVLVDEDNTPLAGALVEAMPVGPAGKNAAEDALSQSVSDDRGEFRLSGLVPGDYLIRAIDPAFQLAGDAAGVVSYPATYFPGTLSEKDAVRVSVSARAPLEGLRFALHIRASDRAPGAAPAPQTPQPPAQNTIPGRAPARPAPPPTGVISGRITSLVDGKPLARARVSIAADEITDCPPNAPVASTDACRRYSRVELTDKDGRYTIDNLPRGKTFVVTAIKSGFAARAFGETPPAVPPVYVVLKDGEKRDDINIQMAPQTPITGTILDEDGTPFAGAVVEGLRAVYAEGKRSFVSSAVAVSDDRGQFRLFGLAPGQYYVTAFDPAYAHVGDDLGQLVYGPTYYHSTVYQDDAVRVTLDPGAPRSGLEFKLQIIRPARLTGKLNASGLPMLGGSVNIGPSRSTRSASFSSSEADIRPDGVFQFANILAERYVIRARAEVERNGVSHFALWTQPVQGADVKDVDMLLSPGAEVAGIVQWESKKGTLAPADQTAIRVRSPMSDGSTFGDTLTGGITLDRTFRLRGVMAGEHYIRVENLPEPWSVKKVLWNGSDVTDIAMPMEYRTLYDGFEVWLTDVYTTLSGTVEVAPGDLAQSYAVIAFPVNPLQWHPVSRFVKITYLDDKGHYFFRGLPPAEYYVAVTRSADESDLATPALLDNLAQNAATIRLGEGDRRMLPLRAIHPRRH
jgi:protocatechuate 3,4-dioxygenase beta subunit